MTSREHMDATLFALSNGTRRTILNRLAESPATYKELEEVVPIRHNNIRKQIGVLEKARLVNVDKDGPVAILSLNAKRLGEAIRWLEEEQLRWSKRKIRGVKRRRKSMSSSSDEKLDMAPDDTTDAPEI